jgi:hypothetical protein
VDNNVVSKALAELTRATNAYIEAVCSNQDYHYASRKYNKHVVVLAAPKPPRQKRRGWYTEATWSSQTDDTLSLLASDSEKPEPTVPSNEVFVDINLLTTPVEALSEAVGRACELATMQMVTRNSMFWVPEVRWLFGVEPENGSSAVLAYRPGKQLLDWAADNLDISAFEGIRNAPPENTSSSTSTGRLFKYTCPSCGHNLRSSKPLLAECLRCGKAFAWNEKFINYHAYADVPCFPEHSKACYVCSEEEIK